MRDHLLMCGNIDQLFKYPYIIGLSIIPILKVTFTILIDDTMSHEKVRMGVGYSLPIWSPTSNAQNLRYTRHFLINVH